jgi:adenosylcobinamide-phosphate guanylyltransferase
MGITALVMAGGKGTRMKTREEKPLLKVGGKPLIEHVLDALKNATKVDKIIVAVSPYTPKTAKTAKRFAVQVFKTPGKDYVFDACYAIKKLKLGTVLVVSADLPVINGKHIDKIIEYYYQSCNKPALVVMVPVETYKRLGLKPNYISEVEGKRLTPAGINIIDGTQIDNNPLQEDIFIIDREEIALNVNTPKDLKIAERLIKT